MFGVHTVGVGEVLIKGLPEQIKNPNVSAGGGTWGFGLWVNSLALHSWLKQSKTNKKTAFKGKALLVEELVNSLFVLRRMFH